MDHQHHQAVLTNTDLYEQDLYAWCLTTAALVRSGQWEAIDPEALTEELESLGRSQKREVKSRLEVLLLHLLKWQHQPLLRTESHSWSDTILEQRSQLQHLLGDNPSLRAQVPALVAEVYPDARTRAAWQMMPMAPRSTAGLQLARLLRLPETCPWPDAQVLDKDCWPGA